MAEGCPEAARLAGARVLVAEDEFVIALEIEATLREFGCLVLGPTASVADTLDRLTRELPDAALIDVELRDGPATAVVEAWRRGACRSRWRPATTGTGSPSPPCRPPRAWRSRSVPGSCGGCWPRSWRHGPTSRSRACVIRPAL